jgi:endonuclease YncB( thermonuclease family)
MAGSDRIAALQRDIRRVQAQLDATAARVSTLTARRDLLAAELKAAGDRAARARADLAAARKEVTATGPALASARPAHDAAGARQKSARAQYDAAQSAMTRAQARLDELTAAADKAAGEVRRAAAAAQKAGSGSASGQQIFTTWQMEAVVDRAAHARMLLVEDSAADSFVSLQEAEAALTKADFSEAEAAKALEQAQAARASASARVTTLTQERDAARAAVAGLTKDSATVSAALDRASALSGKLTTRLAGLRKKVADLEGNLASGVSVSRSSVVAGHVSVPVVTAAGITSDRVRPASARVTMVTGPPASGPVRPRAAAVPAKTGKEAWRESGQVVRVLDGDTFDMTSDGKVIRVRLTGIQAPESKWCGGKEARKALKAVLPKGTTVRLASIKEKSGNAPTGVWRVKRTAHVKVGEDWVDIAPPLLAKGLVFPFPFIGEDAHNDEYLALGWKASEAGLGLYDATACGASRAAGEQLRLEVVEDGPGPAADSEFVMVFNGSKKDISLSRWMVQDTSPLNAFFFPKGARVRADDYVVVFSGSGTRGVAPDGTKDERFFYAGTGNRWNNDSADIAFLFDSTGKDKTGNLRSWLIVAPGS